MIVLVRRENFGDTVAGEFISLDPNYLFWLTSHLRLLCIVYYYRRNFLIDGLRIVKEPMSVAESSESTKICQAGIRHIVSLYDLA